MWTESILMSWITLNLLTLVSKPKLWSNSGNCFTCTWKGCVFYCCWMECSLSVNYVNMVDSVFQIFYIFVISYFLCTTSINHGKMSIESDCNCGFIYFSCISIIYFEVLVFVFLFFWPCGMWDLSSPTRNGTRAPCSGSTGSQPLDRQGSPLKLCFQMLKLLRLCNLMNRHLYHYLICVY